MNKYKVEYRRKGNPYGKATCNKVFQASSFEACCNKSSIYKEDKALTWLKMTRLDTGETFTLEQVRDSKFKGLPKDR